MTCGIIDRGNHQAYTYMSDVFRGLDNGQKQYNWLITDCVCYPKDLEIEAMLHQPYCWLSGDELTALVEKEDVQWIWGCLWGFESNIPLAEVLRYSLPSPEDYDGCYQNPVSLRHPLSSIEIVACDSTYTLILAKDQALIDGYKKHCPNCEDLASYNQSSKT